ncbi:MAG: hypothetical protein AAF714_03335 [Pseudomonadota bacterium]
MKADKFLFFEVLLIVAIIGTLGYFLTTPTMTGSPHVHIPVLSLQVLVSAYAGYKIFPRIFKNDDLDKYQESVLSSIMTVLKADTEDRVHFAFAQAIEKIVGGIGGKVSSDFIKKQGKNMDAFIESIDGSTSISAAALGDRIKDILDQGPIPIGSEADKASAAKTAERSNKKSIAQKGQS